MRAVVAGLGLLLAACGPAQAPTVAPRPPDPIPAPGHIAPGLVPLPCEETGPLRPVLGGYCVRQRHYVTDRAEKALQRAAKAVAAKHPGSTVLFMEASWPTGVRPMPPHHSHGDGRQIDLALFYADDAGRPLERPPTKSGYRASEPPRRESERVCKGVRSAKNDWADPPADRPWRLDETRTRDMIRVLSADPAVRRIFLEPHLKTRLGFARDPKVRFAGCRAARHDDHIHVDFR